MKLAVLGAGLMGRAALYDLCRAEGVDEVGIYDIDEGLAHEIARQYGDAKTVAGSFDAGDEEAAKKLLAGFDSAVSCVTYRYNPGLTRAAIASKCHLVDLGGNNDTVAAQLEMNDEAEKAGVSIIPDCGLAPGMVALLVADGFQKMDSVDSVKIRVGGLPQSPRPPLNYMMVFSAEGLINEYWEPCVIIENGQKKTVNPMSAVEKLYFDGVGDLEAFYTSGGTSTLPDNYGDKVDFLDYKTIRYPGHCDLFRPMLEIGLASRQAVEVDNQSVVPRSLLKAVLDKNLSYGDLDLVLVRVTVDGKRGNDSSQIVYEVIDRQQSKESLTAMMRMTSFPAAIVAWMAASGQVKTRGAKPQEMAIDPQAFIPQLKKRGINLTLTES
ncbi:MAG: saccharopine dehydrogenase C-terminal domain-containing protein [candidate division Zixibacteria bacterium]